MLLKIVICTIVSHFSFVFCNQHAQLPYLNALCVIIFLFKLPKWQFTFKSISPTLWSLFLSLYKFQQLVAFCSYIQSCDFLFFFNNLKVFEFPKFKKAWKISLLWWFKNFFQQVNILEKLFFATLIFINI